MLCGDLDGWERGVGQRFTCVHIADILQLIHFTVQQKLTQPCKAIIFQYVCTYMCGSVHTSMCVHVLGMGCAEDWGEIWSPWLTEPSP